jgi:hypothetical protein
VARFNEILVGRYNKALTKLFSIKGSAPAPQLASEIGPTIEIEQVPVELRFLTSVDSFATFLTNAGVAAVLSTIKFRNPVGSNVVAIFEKISFAIGTSAGVSIQMGTDQTDGGLLVALVSGNNLDPRSGRISSLILSRSVAAAPPSQTGIEQATVLSNTMYDFISYQNQEITLMPGRNLQLVMDTANITLATSFKWRERLLEESERQ